MFEFLQVIAIRDMVFAVHHFHPKRKAEKWVLKEKNISNPISYKAIHFILPFFRSRFGGNQPDRSL